MVKNDLFGPGDPNSQNRIFDQNTAFAGALGPKNTVLGPGAGGAHNPEVLAGFGPRPVFGHFFNSKIATKMTKFPSRILPEKTRSEGSQTIFWTVLWGNAVRPGRKMVKI